jgi:hypothetical protein
MPFYALAWNIIWEFHFSFVDPMPVPFNVGNVIWFLLDLVMLFQYFLYDRSHNRVLFTLNVVGSFSATYTLLIASIYEWNDFDALYYVLVDNIVMSLLFVNELLKGEWRGHTSLVGWTKLIGTQCACYIICSSRPLSIMLPLFSVFIAFLDILYIYLLPHPKSNGRRSS